VVSKSKISIFYSYLEDHLNRKWLVTIVTIVIYIYHSYDPFLWFYIRDNPLHRGLLNHGLTPGPCNAFAFATALCERGRRIRKLRSEVLRRGMYCVY
jgi:hypothetical protein